MIEVYEKDDDNIYAGVVHIVQDSEIPINCVKVRPVNGLHRARWTGVEWIENMTQEEIDDLNTQSNELSFEELQVEQNVDLDYRLSVLEMGL